MSKVVVVMPTYNEAENLPKMVRDVLRLGIHGLEVLVVDDNSPDGTGQVAEELVEEYPDLVHVLHRESKKGLGRAYLAGFHWALAHGADCVFEMDADFSHDPAYIPRFLEEIKTHDVVVGSRYVQGGGVGEGWSTARRLLSQGGNLYSRLSSGLKVKDTTAGFKCFRRDALLGLDLDDIRSDGYAFQIEVALACQRAGYRVREIPITFLERQAGQSKMSGRIVLEAMGRVWQIRRKRSFTRPGVSGSRKPSLRDAGDE